MGRRIVGLIAFSTAAVLSGCSKSSSSSAADAGSDGPLDAGITACTAVASAGTDGAAALDGSSGRVGEADDFGPNAKVGSAASALGQLDIYEVTRPRRLEWVDLYLRTEGMTQPPSSPRTPTWQAAWRWLATWALAR